MTFQEYRNTENGKKFCSYHGVKDEQSMKSICQEIDMYLSDPEAVDEVFCSFFESAGLGYSDFEIVTNMY